MRYPLLGLSVLLVLGLAVSISEGQERPRRHSGAALERFAASITLTSRHLSGTWPRVDHLSGRSYRMSDDQPPHQPALDRLYQQEIAARRYPEEEQEGRGKGCKPERACQRGVWEEETNQHDCHGRDRQRPTGLTAQGVAGGADHKENERLRRQGLHKPARVEQRFGSVEELEEHEEGQEIINGAQWPDEQHEVADHADVPALRLAGVARVDIIRGDCHLGQ